MHPWSAGCRNTGHLCLIIKADLCFSQDKFTGFFLVIGNSLAICMWQGFLPGGIQPGGGLALPGLTCLKSETFKSSVDPQVGPGVPVPCFS